VTVSLNGGPGSGGDAQGDGMSGIENLTGSAFADTLTGDGNANVLRGSAGADTMAGKGGNDTYVVDNIGDNVVETVGNGIDTIVTSVSYALRAGSEVEKLAALGSTTMTAINLTGNEVNNTLIGNGAENLLSGGAGADRLFGEAGADTFVFKSIGDSTVASSGRDTVADFSHVHGDKIDLHAIDAQTTVGGNQAFSFIGKSGFSHHAGELDYKVVGGNAFVFGDVNGDGKADFSIAVAHVTSLSASDFIL
jgi:Ca2+-binding RTX toxin-like protein